MLISLYMQIKTGKMLQFLLLLLITTISANTRFDLYNECRRLFNPINYMNQLPSLSLPYVASVKIPMSDNNHPLSVKPSPVKPTKVISVTTQYIYKNPICVKVTGKKALCQSNNSDNNLDFLVTKEYFVNDRNQKHYLNGNDLAADVYLETSEHVVNPFGKTTPTPKLTSNEIRDLLIDDRLDHLETILPHYTRQRVYQTTTITVTKVISNNRATATLLVKNCIPQGYDLCPPKINKKRKSKVAQITNATTIDEQFHG